VIYAGNGVRLAEASEELAAVGTGFGEADCRSWKDGVTDNG